MAKITDGIKVISGKKYSDPARAAQEIGRRISGYPSGTMGGGLVYGSGKDDISTDSDKDTDKDLPTKTPKRTNTSDLAALLRASASAKQNLTDQIYGNNMARIGEAYDRIAGNLGGNYESTVSRLKAARDRSLRDVRADAESALKQAYANNEMTKRNLDQRLAAMGYNGGATETSMLRLANEYANSRGGINNTLNKNIADLNMTYGDNLANALQAYNSAMNQLEMQRMQLENAAENARANGSTSNMDISALLSGSNASYLQALQNALANQGAFQYQGAEATNNYTPGNVQQANSIENGSNYQKMLAQAQLDAQNGKSIEDIQRSLYPEVQSGNLTINSLAQLIRQLRAAG